MGDWFISWFTDNSKYDASFNSIRLNNVTEDFIDGCIYVLKKEGIAKGEPIKELID